MQPEYAFLCPTKSAGGTIFIDKTMFVLGRSRGVSFDLRHVSISREHCTFSFENETWLLTDKSSSGTFINGKKMTFGSTQKIKSDDVIQFGNYHRAFEFGSVSSHFLKNETSNKKAKIEERPPINDLHTFPNNEKSDDTPTKADFKKLMHEKEEIQNRLLQEKLELEKKVKEMQELLDRKAAEGEERVRDLEQRCLQKEAENQEKMKQLVADLNEKESAAKSLLDSHLRKLQEDKEKLEKEIKEQLSKKEEESRTKVEQLQQELYNIKEKLTTVEQKKQCLEKELEEAMKAKEFASTSNLKTKEEVLNNFHNLLEAELQCSICNELFVTPTILNCSHTFCKFCITSWKKEKRNCPVCRKKITSENGSLALNNFVARMVEFKKKQEERAVVETVTSMSETPKRAKRRRPDTPDVASVIILSSDSDSEDYSSEDYGSMWDFYIDQQSTSSEEDVEGE